MIWPVFTERDQTLWRQELNQNQTFGRYGRGVFLDPLTPRAWPSIDPLVLAK